MKELHEAHYKLAVISMLLSVPGEQLTDGARMGGVLMLDEIREQLREAES